MLTRPDQLMAGDVLLVNLEQHLIIRQRLACPAQPIMFQVQSTYDLSLTPLKIRLVFSNHISYAYLILNLFFLNFIIQSVYMYVIYSAICLWSVIFHKQQNKKTKNPAKWVNEKFELKICLKELEPWTIKMCPKFPFSSFFNDHVVFEVMCVLNGATNV